jgi:hypothetical protein
MNSSMRISRPALPKTRSLSMASIARSASVALCAITTPLPAARPEALITTGAANWESAIFASFAWLW